MPSSINGWFRQNASCSKAPSGERDSSHGDPGDQGPGRHQPRGRLKNCVCRLAEHLEIESPWDLEVVAMLSQIGYAVVPGDIVDRARAGHSLTDAAKQMLDSHPKIARELLAHIPRLEPVAEMIGALVTTKVHPADSRVALGVREPISVRVPI